MTTRTNRRRRNYHANEGLFSSRNSNRWHDMTDHAARTEPPRIGAYSVTARDGHNHSNHSPFHPEAKRQKPHNSFATSKPAYDSRKRLHYNNILPNPVHNHFQIGSKRFKKYLLDSINQTFQQIQQWYPDRDGETTESDGMDWQPECEVLIPQPVEEVHYIWDTKPLPNLPIMEELDAKGGKLRTGIPTTMPGGRGIASEGSMDGRKPVGLIDVGEIPRKNGFVSPRSVGPDTGTEA